MSDEQRRTAQDLQKDISDNAWLAAIIDSSDDAIISKTLDGRVTSWNRAATRIFGFSADEMVGQSITRIIPPELQAEEERILAQLRRGERIDHFETVRITKAGARIHISLTVSPMRDAAGNLIAASKVVRDISERKKAEATRNLLVNELNHRVKNTLASVQAIAQGTLRRTKDPAQFVDSFAGRIQSLARVHSLLSDTTWQGADLRTLIGDQLMLGPVDESRVTAWGPAVDLEPQMAVHVGLMLHELGTNAGKYGALSTPEGWVTVGWTVAGDVLNLQWVERGGPAVAIPSTRGFGTTLIEQSAKSEGGSSLMMYDGNGITWQISLPLPGAEASKASLREVNWVGGAKSPSSSPPSPARPLSGRRLLVVEDEPLVALDIVGVLEDAGAAVSGPAGTEKDALHLIATETFDAALLDANLHGRPVDEVAAALASRNIPFAFVSGHARAGLPVAFATFSLLSKPFSHQELVETVSKLLRHDAALLTS